MRDYLAGREVTETLDVDRPGDRRMLGITLVRARERSGRTVHSVTSAAGISAADLALTESGEAALPAARLVDVLHVLNVPVGMAVDGSLVLVCQPDGSRLAIRYRIPYEFAGSMSRVAIDGSREGDRIRVLRSRVTELLGDAGERALTRVLNMLEAPRGEDVSLA
jgi:hypothetical protein